MDDRFLNELRKEPRPEFVAGLRERLRAREERRGVRFFPIPAMAAAAVLLIAGILAFPSVRVSAQNLLDFFRVRRFAAVEFDASRLEKLKALDQDNAMLIFDRQEKIQSPGPARSYPTAEAAGAAAGITVRRPGFLPNALVPDSVFVEGEGEVRLSVSPDKLRNLLDRLDLRDVKVPDHLDGDWIHVRKPPIVTQSFRSGNLKAGIAQARSPEVSLPSGVDVELLAETGLRILGLDAGEARRMARATDWRTTLLVPVPVNASTFRQVTIRGQSGLLITTSGVSSDGERHREGTIILWTEGEDVFGLRTNMSPADAVQMAESVQ